MPSLSHVSYNSSRVQRAYKINNIETMKLNRKIELMEKERKHSQRLNNQDIRLISLTLDYIQTSSGYSNEGMPPEGSISQQQSGKELEPCFLYGERIVSRQKRRNIRPQSAMDKSILGSKQNSETASVLTSVDNAFRPQSSPNRRKPSFLTIDDLADGNVSEFSRSGSTTPRFRPAWIEEPPSDVTKILIRAATADGKKRSSIFERNRDKFGSGSASLKTLSRSLRIKQHSQPEEAADTQPYMPGRGARITDILNSGKSSMSASTWKSHLNNAQTGPVNSSLQKKQIMDNKKAVVSAKTEFLQGKVKHFVAS